LLHPRIMSELRGERRAAGESSNADRLFFSSDLEAQHAVGLKSEAQVRHAAIARQIAADSHAM
jgi:hypothetical protein